MTGDIIVALVVVTALGFDFTNGFHDTANAMATTIATGALRPKIAVAIAAVLNFVGAFISLKVAATVAGGIVDADAITPTVVFGGLVGAICWNLATWWFGLPSSSSHALIGGVVGSTLVAAGGSAVEVNGIVSKWVIVACATAIALGTYSGGWRIIKTLGTKVVEVRPPQGFGSEAVAATVILASSHVGYPLSTTQVVSGAVTGSGVGRANRATSIEPEETVSENPTFGPAPTATAVPAAVS
jgi:PiT family inorganic phosphate transporter